MPLVINRDFLFLTKSQKLAAVRSRISLACSRISPAKALFRLASKFGFVPALPFRPVHITDTEKNGFPLFICCFSAQVFLDKSDHVYSQIFAFCLRFHLLIRGRTRRGRARAAGTGGREQADPGCGGGSGGPWCHAGCSPCTPRTAVPAALCTAYQTSSRRRACSLMITTGQAPFWFRHGGSWDSQGHPRHATRGPGPAHKRATSLTRATGQGTPRRARPEAQSPATVRANGSDGLD